VNETLMENTILLAAQAAELERMRREAEFLATHDVLTGVLNRRAWFQQATSTKPHAVALFDIDHFKGVNDRYGHPAGDHVLLTVAARLAAALGDRASLGRVGGEEFGALLFDESFDVAVATCETALAEVAATVIELPSGGFTRMTLSAGVSPWISGRLSREESLALTYEAADRLLYQAKNAGRAQLAVSPLKSAA
jgi:diguanylate cyclase (GGDEF)-like protein